MWSWKAYGAGRNKDYSSRMGHKFLEELGALWGEKGENYLMVQGRGNLEDLDMV